MGRGLLVALVAVGVSLAPASGLGVELDDLLAGFQIVPLGDQLALPFTLESLGGAVVTLADLRGRVVVLYFWESG